MEIRLDGRTALVTGGSAGLGLAMATRFAASGASVGIVARRPEVLEAAAEQIRRAAGVAGDAEGGRAPAGTRQAVAAVAADVSDPAQLAAAHGRVVDELGPIDILVNNAGTSAAKPF